jgi:hypothetical protein
VHRGGRGLKAIEQGIAGIEVSREELMQTAESIIKKSREETKLLMDNGYMGDVDVEF